MARPDGPALQQWRILEGNGDDCWRPLDVLQLEARGAPSVFRDKLALPYTDVGEGWLIFDLPDAEMGCHPVEKEPGQQVPSGTHYISFYCDDTTRRWFSWRLGEWSSSARPQTLAMVWPPMFESPEVSRSNSTSPTTCATPGVVEPVKELDLQFLPFDGTNRRPGCRREVEQCAVCATPPRGGGLLYAGNIGRKG